MGKLRVVVGGEHSAWTEVLSGVPQGTVLGPLLFLVYINDLPQNIHSEVRLFADDCVLRSKFCNASSDCVQIVEPIVLKKVFVNC